jgi:predicted RNA polymerase sigma factor
VVELNRAIVLAELRGPDEGPNAIYRIRGLEVLDDYHYLGATLGQLHLDAGDPERAGAWFERARQLTDSRSLKELLDRKLHSTFS